MRPWLQRPNRSVFVAFTPLERALIISLLLFFALFAFPFVISSGSLTRLLMYVAFLAYLLTLSLPFLIKKFCPSLFHPLCFYVLWVGIQGLLRGQLILPISGLEYHNALGTHHASYFDILIAFSFFLDSIGLLFFYIGYIFFPKIKVRTLSIPSTKWLFFKVSIWVGIAGFGLLALATIGGGLDQVLMQRGIASDQRISSQVGGHWAFLAGLGVVAPMVWLACEPNVIRKKIFWIILIITLMIKFASTGSRGGTITPLIFIGAIFILQNKKIPYREIVIGAFIALLIIGAGGQFRKATMQNSSLGEVEIESGISDWIISAVEEMQTQGGSNSGQLAVLGNVPNNESYLLGESYLSVPFILLPRAIFGDKPDAGGRLLSTIIYKNPLNTVPPSAVGEAFWNFSYFGVVFVFLIHGVILKIISSIFFINSKHPLILILFVFFIFRFKLDSDSLYSLTHTIIPAIIIYVSFLKIKIKGLTFFK